MTSSYPPSCLFFSMLFYTRNGFPPLQGYHHTQDMACLPLVQRRWCRVVLRHCLSLRSKNNQSVPIHEELPSYGNILINALPHRLNIASVNPNCQRRLLLSPLLFQIRELLRTSLHNVISPQRGKPYRGIVPYFLPLLLVQGNVKLYVPPLEGERPIPPSKLEGAIRPSPHKSLRLPCIRAVVLP